MRHDRPALAGRLAAAALVAGVLATVVAYAADAPPGPPAWVIAAAETPPTATAVAPASDPGEAAAVAAPPAPASVVVASSDAAAVPILPGEQTAAAAVVPAAEAAPVVAAAPAAVEAAPAPRASARSAPSRGVGCITVGAIASVGALVYSNTVGAAVTGGANSGLLMPLMAASYAVGCGIGAAVTPTLAWLTGH